MAQENIRAWYSSGRYKVLHIYRSCYLRQAILRENLERISVDVDSGGYPEIPEGFVLCQQCQDTLEDDEDC